MSRFIDLVETLDLRTLTSTEYGEKIDGLLNRFPTYERDSRFRTVLPEKIPKTADDYISMKLCTKGRFPIFGIYTRRDLHLVGVCAEGTMFALDSDLHPSFVPDLKFCKVYLDIQHTPLAKRETLEYTKECMCSAISTLSLGYTPEKKNEWCNAIVLLTGMTSQAVRFPDMKSHIQTGLCIWSKCRRYVLDNESLAMQNRWNKISMAIRREQYPYIYSFYRNHGIYATGVMCDFSAQFSVSLINGKNKIEREKFRRRNDEWNGPLKNRKRKRKEECKRRWMMQQMKKAQAYRNTEKMHNESLERVHGFWYGSVDPFKYEVASVKCLPRPVHSAIAKRFITSATSHLDRLKDVLQVQRVVASMPPAVKNIWNEGCLVSFFRGTSLILDNCGSNMDASSSYLWRRRPRTYPWSWGQTKMRTATPRVVVECVRPVFTAAAFYLSAKLHKIKVENTQSIKLWEASQSKYDSDPYIDRFGISEDKINSEKVKWNREPRPFVQLDCGQLSGALRATCVYPLQVINTRIQAQLFITNAGYSGMAHLFMGTLQHESLTVKLEV